MKILGIETSCDETAVAVVLNGTTILSNVVSSSVNLHQKTGGIVPEIAARKQVESIIPVLDESLTSANISLKEVDAIAVTVGPGLIGSLIVGVTTAKMLAMCLNKPLIPVNHLLAHIYANWLKQEPQKPAPAFPLIGLIVSGGHTELILMKDHNDIRPLGATRDDAAGESFDKVSRILKLGYPGGPAIEKKAKEMDPKKVALVLPKPLINSKDYDFSFSGLKTATFAVIQKKTYSPEEIAFCFQEAVSTVLVKKTVKAALEYKVKSVVVAGGVSANRRLKEVFLQNEELKKNKVEIFIPKLEHCTDNAASIAACAYYHNNPKPVDEVTINTTINWG
ncbi:MAG: tRNA (adenosine(37)-N6)-threonylcarbamoyltransferase complex transferase subunit TsaD [Patescibacteria group bacterium]|nr:tRNA (adenosine(37)-N6)-threonylcarbamoyltransferase complex transferase subunit TsaD [Patescibacteria group bacterium]